MTEVIFSRLAGVALINSPLTMTVWSLCAGRLNSLADQPEFVFPTGGAAGTSLGDGALALLGTGSVAFT